MSPQGTDNSQGLIWSADTTGNWWLHSQISDVDQPSKAIATGTLPATLAAGVWHTYRIDVNGTVFRAWMDSQPVLFRGEYEWLIKRKKKKGVKSAINKMLSCRCMVRSSDNLTFCLQ